MPRLESLTIIPDGGFRQPWSIAWSASSVSGVGATRAETQPRPLPPRRAAPRQRSVRRRRRGQLTGVVAVLGAVVIALLSAGCAGSAAGNGSPTGHYGALGTLIRIPVPTALRQLPLTNQYRRHVTLDSWPGRTVLVVPFLTLCQEECPLTTGNLIAVTRSLRADGATARVQIIELSVDPVRDTPARLAAYAKLTGVNWQLVTTPPAELHALAKFFGFFYTKVPEGNPPGIDWWTGRPLTYDVHHSDNYFVIDASGVERVVQIGSPDFHGHLKPQLESLLDGLGRQNLRNPPQPSWTPTDVLNALTVSVGQPLPAVSG